MHIATLVTLILVSILIVSIRLLFSFSYDTFIPWNIGFGLYLYFIFHFIIFLGRETYFHKSKNSSQKKLSYVVTPTFLTISVGFFILFKFKVISKYNGIGEGWGAGFEQLITYLLLFIGLIVIEILVTIFANSRYKAVYENNKPINIVIPFNDIIKQISLFIIPILITLIGYISFLIYSDYSTAGMKHNYTTSSNIKIMYKKAIKNQDITFCDYIVNANTKEWGRERCYADFFKQVKEIKEFKGRYRVDQVNINFFSLYAKLKTQQCQRSDKPTVCENILLEKTYRILETTSKKEVILKEKTKFLLINVYGHGNYKGMHDFLVNDLEKFMTSSITSIEESLPNEFSSTYTQIYIDIKKLVNNESDLLAIEKAIELRKIDLEKTFRQVQKIQREKNELKQKEAVFKYQAKMRKKYYLKPDDLIKPCADRKYLKCDCVIPMCVNGVFVYDSLYGLINHKLRGINIYQHDRCLDNIQQGKKPCDNSISRLYHPDIRLKHLPHLKRNSTIE